jgi:transposase
MATSKFVGLDVHKNTTSVAVADAAGGEPRYLGVIGSDDASIRKLVRKLGAAKSLCIAYEAGPTGYGLHRLLATLGCKVMVVAPSLIPRRAGDRVKTDRRDALQLARLLRAGELSPIEVPGPEQEALRDLSRAREDAVCSRQKARQQLASFLLRHGRRFEGKTTWSRQHRRWLQTQKFEHPAQQLAFEEYCRAVEQGDARIDRLTDALELACEESPARETVAALQSLKGIKLITAMALMAELGDITRFTNPKQLMAYVGLVPSEHSSGNRVRRGGITKTGNGHARRLLTESAWNYRYPPRQTETMTARQRGQPDTIHEIAWQAQVRLNGKFRRLRHRGKKSTVAVCAVARELLGFVWAVAVEVKKQKAA